MTDTRGRWLVRSALIVLVIGVLAVLIASVVVEPAIIEPDSARWWRGLWTAAVAVAFWLILRARVGVEVPQEDEAGARPATGRSVVAVVLAALPFLTNAPLIQPGLETGLPPTGAILATVASAVAVLAVVALWVVPRRAAGWWPHRRGLAAVPAAAASVALVVAAATAVPVADATLVHVTAPAEPTSAAAVPDSLGRIAWTKELGPRELPRAVSPIVGGLALETDDGTGITALDGATGEDRWTHRRSGAKVQAMFPADDGRLLVVTFGHGRATRYATQEWSWTVLDAQSGEALHGPHRGNPFEYFGRDTAVVGDVVLTNTGPSRTSAPRRALDVRSNTELWTCERSTECHAFVGTSDEAFIFAAPAATGSRFRAVHASTGEELWSYAHDSSCDLRALHDDDTIGPAGESDVVVGYCADSAVVVALDTATGEERWTGERADSAAVDWSFAIPGALSFPNVRTQHEEATSVIDIESGELLTTTSWYQLPAARIGDLLIVSERDGRKVAQLHDLDTGDVTEPDHHLEVTAEHCTRLDDGLHCAHPYDGGELVTSFLQDGVTTGTWSDLGVPPGLRAWPSLQGPARQPVHLLAVDGAVVLGASRGATYERQVVVGLQP